MIGLQIPRRVGAVLAGGLLISLSAGAAASATIPGDGDVFDACMLKNVGTIRLIDPSLPSSNLMSHCTPRETQVSWNQSGQPGPQGPPGVLTSPNGAYSVSVTDAGIVLRAPGATARLAGSDITLASGGATTVQTGTSFELLTGTSLSLASGGNTTLQTAQRLAATSGSDTSLAVGKDLSVAVDGATSVRGTRDVSVESGSDATIRGETGVLFSSPGRVTVNGAPIP
jgi:hypothetical protein